MSSIFIGQTGLRHQYYDLTAAQLAAATNATSAVLIGRIRMDARLAFIDNTLNADVAMLLVHPDADATVVANRLFFIEVPSTRVLNYDVGAAPGLHFDGGTRMYVYYLGATAPSIGKLRIIMWG